MQNDRLNSLFWILQIASLPRRVGSVVSTNGSHLPSALKSQLPTAANSDPVSFQKSCHLPLSPPQACMGRREVGRGGGEEWGLSSPLQGGGEEGPGPPTLRPGLISVGKKFRRGGEAYPHPLGHLAIPAPLSPGLTRCPTPPGKGGSSTKKKQPLPA